MSQRIEIRSVYFSNRINNDAGSGASKDLSTWKPDLPNGWFYLGPGASSGSRTTGIIVREIVAGTLGSIGGWDQVWNDAGSGNSTDYSLWKAKPERSDHIAFGGFFCRSHNQPTYDDARGIKTLPLDLLVEVSADPEIWNDAGTGAGADGAVWGITTVGNVRAVNTGAFVPVNRHNTRPGHKIYAINGNNAQVQVAASALDSNDA